jgi:prepilin-type N-terminal cleavage/methylation domain-containing protein
MTRTAPLRRPAFTLVELLVVVALIVLLAALVVAVSQSGLLGSQKVVSAADRASGWLLIAKQRALRDRAPRGVRFLLTPVQDPLLNPPSSGDPNYQSYYMATEAQYIEAPDPWVPNPNQELNPTGPRIVFSYQFDTATKQFTAFQVYYVSFNPTNPAAGVADMLDYDQRVFANDMLVLPEFGTSFRIANPNTTPNAGLTLGGVPVPAANCRLITLQNPPDLAAAFSPMVPPGTPPQGTLTTYKYGFQGQPRPLLGEPTVQLTGNTIIDFRDPAVYPTNQQTTFGVTYPAGIPAAQQKYFDILFSPSGSVMFNPSGLICLWVRDPDKVAHPRLDPTTGAPNDATGFNAAGEQVLVTVYTQTGLIATHPVNPSGLSSPGYDPYQYAKDGVNSGL